MQLQLLDRSLMASTERDHEREKERGKDGQLAALTASLAAETARADALQEKLLLRENSDREEAARLTQLAQLAQGLPAVSSVPLVPAPQPSSQFAAQPVPQPASLPSASVPRSGSSSAIGSCEGTDALSLHLSKLLRLADEAIKHS